MVCVLNWFWGFNFRHYLLYFIHALHVRLFTTKVGQILRANISRSYFSCYDIQVICVEYGHGCAYIRMCHTCTQPRNAYTIFFFNFFFLFIYIHLLMIDRAFRALGVSALFCWALCRYVCRSSHYIELRSLIHTFQSSSQPHTTALLKELSRV